MFGLGYPELGLIVFVGLLLFGAKRLPELAKSIGQSINAFKAGLKEGSGQAGAAKTESPKPPEEKKP